MVKDMFRFLAKRKIEKSEYDIVYHWYEEKREECEMLRKIIEDITHRPIEITLVMRKTDG